MREPERRAFSMWLREESGLSVCKPQECFSSEETEVVALEFSVINLRFYAGKW